MLVKGGVMKSQVNPAVVAVIIIVVLAAIGIYYWKFAGGGSGYQASLAPVPGMSNPAAGGAPNQAVVPIPAGVTAGATAGGTSSAPAVAMPPGVGH